MLKRNNNSSESDAGRSDASGAVSSYRDQYRRRGGSPNGLLPPTLLRDTQPYFNFSAKFQILASYYESRGKTKESEQMRGLADAAEEYSALFGEPDAEVMRR